jgi:regulator of replication initiation timing
MSDDIDAKPLENGDNMEPTKDESDGKINRDILSDGGRVFRDNLFLKSHLESLLEENAVMSVEIGKMNALLDEIAYLQFHMKKLEYENDCLKELSSTGGIKKYQSLKMQYDNVVKKNKNLLSDNKNYLEQIIKYNLKVLNSGENKHNNKT